MTVITVKPGVEFKRFTPALIRIISAIDYIAGSGRELVPGLPEELVITSANDSTHSTGSRHYTDEALDLRSKNFPNQACKDLFLHAIRVHLGPLFTVLHEYVGGPQEHFHFQPKKGTVYPRG